MPSNALCVHCTGKAKGDERCRDAAQTVRWKQKIQRNCNAEALRLNRSEKRETYLVTNSVSNSINIKKNTQSDILS